MSESGEPRVDAEWYRDMISAVNHFAIISMDTEGTVLTWNAGAQNLLGFQPEEIIGQSGRLLFTPEDAVAGAHEREIGIAAIEGHATDDRWHVRRDGSRVWVSGLLMAIRGEDGLVRGLVKVVQDRTENKRLEEDLRASEEQFARVFLGNPAAIAVERADDGVFVLANERFFQLTGYWRSEVMGRSGRDLGIWVDERQRRRVMSGLQPGEPVGARVDIRTKSGEVRSCAATFAATQVVDSPCILATFIPLELDD